MFESVVSTWSSPLTPCLRKALQLPFGKLYGLFSAKWTFLSALFLFELGSLICAVARSSPTFIGGVSINRLFYYRGHEAWRKGTELTYWCR